MKCEICKEREAILTFSNEPFLAMTHGWGKQEICRECFIKKIEAHIKDCQKQLKEQRKILLKEKEKK